MECLSAPATSDGKWRECLSEQALRDERLLPADKPWDMEGIENMEFTSEQLKEIVELNKEMRDEP